MSTVDEIVGAAARLDATQFLQLRQKLEELEKQLWEAEFAKTADEMERTNVTEETIDALVMRRRYFYCVSKAGGVSPRRNEPFLEVSPRANAPGQVRRFVSDGILDELTGTRTEDLGRSNRYAALARGEVLRLAKPVALPTTSQAFVPGDPNDDPIVQTALSAKADYLVTADTELLKVGKVQDLAILTARQGEEKLGPEAK